MPGVRDHEPVVIEEFGGWWARGDDESCPLDHFTVCQNVQFFNSGLETRDPLDPFQEIASPISKIIRTYTYIMQTGQTLLVLVQGGKLYHCVSKTIIHGPILEIDEMMDFGFVAINGYAYITPFKTYTNASGQNYELGIKNEFVYVYKGDGTPARKAAGEGATGGGGGLVVYPQLSGDGKITPGIHVIGITQWDNEGTNNDSGTLGPEFLGVVYVQTDDTWVINVANVPQADADIATRNVYMTAAIDPANWNPTQHPQASYLFYLVGRLTDSARNNLVINVNDVDLITGETFMGGGTLPTIDSDSMYLKNSAEDGYCDIGLHVVGVVYETDTGFLTQPGPAYFAVQTYVNESKAIEVLNIPVTTNPAIKKKHLVSTKAIPNYNGNNKQIGFPYQLFFIPNATLEGIHLNDTTKIISYYDSDLVADASHLIDNFSSIPAGVNLNTYHSRMIVVGEFGTDETLVGLPDGVTDNRSVARVSAPGEPEAISKVDGLIIAPLDGNPLTNVQEFRDVLYLFKKTRTFAYSDNSDEPSTWQEEIVDQGVGAPVHGIAAVLDSGGVNIDYLIIADWSGLMLFNGTYARPELSWKIEDFWLAMDRNYFGQVQLANDSIRKKLWITLPVPLYQNVLMADYGNGLDPKNIRWSRWGFNAAITTICLVETTKLIMGALLGSAAVVRKNGIESTIIVDSGLYTINSNKVLRHDTYYGDIQLAIPDPRIKTALLGE